MSNELGCLFGIALVCFCTSKVRCSRSGFVFSFRFNRVLNDAAGPHPQFFNFLATIESDVVSAGITMVYQADQAHFEPPKKMSAAEEALEELAKEAQDLYAGLVIDATQFLRRVASGHKDEDFLNLYKNSETPIRNEADRFFVDPGQTDEEEEEEDDSDAEDQVDDPEPQVDDPEPQVDDAGPYTIDGVRREDIDDRRIVLADDPDLVPHQDERFHWETSNWHLPDPEPRTAEELAQVFAPEDLNKVATNGCPGCRKALTMAVTLRCSHMLCIPCFEDSRVKTCPSCERRKLFAATSHCGTLIHLRKPDDGTRMEHFFSSREALGRRSHAATVEDASNEEDIASSQDLIDDSLRENGVEDPATYRSYLRAQSRIRSRRAEAQTLSSYLAEGPPNLTAQVCECLSPLPVVVLGSN